MILYKYLKGKYLRDFKDKGSIHVSTLYDLRGIEHNPIRDELEGHHGVKISSSKQALRLSGKEFHKMIPVLKMNKQQEEKITVTIEDGAQFNMQIANAFVFCTSLRLDRSLFIRFGYDAHYKITKAFDFATALYERLNQAVMIKGFKIDIVKYLDKPITLTSKNKDQILLDREDQYWNACFTKPRKFSVEQEFRMAFVPELSDKIKPIVLTCPELRRFCSFN